MAEQHHHHHYHHHHGGAPPVPPRYRVQQPPMRMERDYPEEGMETAVYPYEGQPQEGAPIIMYRGQRLGDLDEEDCSMLEVGLYCPYCTGAFTAKFVHQKPVQLPITQSGSFEHILQDVQGQRSYEEPRSPPYDPMLKQDIEKRQAPQVYVEQKQMHYSIKRGTSGRSEMNVLRQMKQWDGRGGSSSPGQLSPDGEAIHSKYSKSATHIHQEGPSHHPNTGSQSTEEIHRKSESRYHYKNPRQYSYKTQTSPQGSVDTVIQKSTSSSRSSKGHSKSESSDSRRKDGRQEMKYPQRKEKRHSADVGMKHDSASAEKFMRETRSHSPGSVQRVPDVYPEHSPTDEDEQVFIESMPDFDYNYSQRHYRQRDHRQYSEQQSEIAQVLQQRKAKLDKRDPRTFEQQQQMAKEIYVPPPQEHRHSFHMPQYVKITPVHPQEHAPVHSGQMSSAKYVSRVPSSPGPHQDFESSIDSVQSRSDYGSMGSSSYTPPYDEGAHLRGGGLSVFDKPYSREGSTSLASSHSSVSSASYSQYKKYSSTETVLQQTAHAKTPERQSAETKNVTRKAPYNKENVKPIPDFCAKEFNMNSPTSPSRKHREIEKGAQSGAGKRNWVEIETDTVEGDQCVPIKKEKMDEKTTPPKLKRLSTEEEALKAKIDALCSQMNQRKNIEIIVQGEDDEEFGYDYEDEVDPNSLAQDIIRGADVRDRISPHRLSAASSAESVNRRHNVMHGSTDSEDVFNRSSRYSDQSFSESDHHHSRSAQFSATSYEDNESISTRSSTSFHYDLIEGAVTTGSAASTPTTSEADSHDGRRPDSETDPILQSLEDDIKREEINLEMTAIADNIRWLNQQEHGPMLPFDLLQRQKMILMEEKERQLAAEAKEAEKAERMKQRTKEREKQEFLKKEDKAIRMKMKEDKKRKRSKKTPPKDHSERYSDTSSSVTSSASSRHQQEVETVTEKVVTVKTTEVTTRETDIDDDVFVQSEHIPERENKDVVENTTPQIVSDHVEIVHKEKRCSSPEEIVDEVLENLDADSYDPNATLERIFTMPRKKKNKGPGSKQQPYREMSPETIFERIVEGMSDGGESQFTPDSSDDEFSQQKAEILLTNTLVGLELLSCETNKNSNHTSIECLAGGTDRNMSTPSDTSFEGEDEMMASITSTNTSNLGGVTSDSETSLERLIDNTKSLTENIMATYVNKKDDETTEAIQKEALNIVTTFGTPEGDIEVETEENQELAQQELVDYVFSPQHEDTVEDPELKKVSKSEVEHDYLFVKSGDVRFKVGSSAESLSSTKSNHKESVTSHRLPDSKTQKSKDLKSTDRHFKVTLVPLVDDETRDEVDDTTTSVQTVTTQTVVTTTRTTTTKQAPPDEYDEDRPPAIPPRPKMYTRDSSTEHFSAVIHSDDYDTETTNESVDREESPGLEIDTSPLRAVSSIVNSFNRKHLRYGYGVQGQGQVRDVDYGVVSPLEDVDKSSSSLFDDEMVHENMSEGDISLDEKDQLDLALQMRLEDMLMMQPPEIKEYASSDDLDERLRGLGDENEADLSFGSEDGRELVSPYGDVRLRHLQPSDGSNEKRQSYSTDDSLQECIVEEEKPGELIHQRLEMRDDKSPMRRFEEPEVTSVGGVRTEIDRREEETVVTSVKTQEMIVKEDSKKIEESKPVPHLDETRTDRTSPLRTTITTVKKHKIECYETYMGSEDPSPTSVKEPSPPKSKEQSPPLLQQVSPTTKVKTVQYYETYMGSEDLPEQKAPEKKKKPPPPVPKKTKKSKEFMYEMIKETTFTVSEKGEEVVKTRRVPASPKTSQTEQELRVLNQIDLNTKMETSAKQEQEVIQEKKQDENEELLYEAIKVIESTLEESLETNKKEETESKVETLETDDKEKESTPSSESMEISENEGTVILADHEQFFDSEIKAKLEHMESLSSTTEENEIDEYVNELLAISFEEALKEFKLIEIEMTRIRNMPPHMDTVAMETPEESVTMETSSQLETVNSGLMSPVPLSEQKCSTYEIKVNSQLEHFPTENIRSPPPEERLPRFIRFDFEDSDSDEGVRRKTKGHGHTTQTYSTDMVVPVVQRKQSPPEEELSFKSEKDVPILMSTSLNSEEDMTDSKYTTQVDMSVGMVTDRQDSYMSSDGADSDNDDDGGDDADDEEEEKEMKTVEQIMDVLRRESQSGDFVYEENSPMEELLTREMSESPVFENIRVSPVVEVPSRELSQSPQLGSVHSGSPDILYNAHSLVTLSQCAVESVNPVLLHIINHPGYKEWYKYWVQAMSHNALYPITTQEVVTEQETVEVEQSEVVLHKTMEPPQQETTEVKSEEISSNVLETKISQDANQEVAFEQEKDVAIETSDDVKVIQQPETEMLQDVKQEVVFEQEKDVPTDNVTINTVIHEKKEFVTHTFQPTEHSHVDLVPKISRPDQPSQVVEVCVPSAEDSMVQNIEYKKVKDGNAVQKHTVITQQQKQFRHSYPGRSGPIYPRKPEFVKKKTPPPIPKRIRKSATPEIVQAPPPQVVTTVTSNTELITSQTATSRIVQAPPQQVVTEVTNEVKTNNVKKKKTPPPIPKRIRKQEVVMENSGIPNQRHSQISDTSNSKRSSKISENSVNVSQTLMDVSQTTVNVSQTSDTSNEFITKVVTIQQQEGKPQIPIKIRKQKIPPPIPPRKGREGSVNRERTLSPEPVSTPSVKITEVKPQQNNDKSKVLLEERKEFKKNVVTQPKPVKTTAPPFAIDTNENVLVVESHSTTLIQKPEIKQLEASPRMQRKNYHHKTEAPPVVDNSTSCDIEISRKMIHDSHPYVDEHIETCKTSTVVAQENIPVIRIHRDGDKNVFSHTKQTDAGQDVTVSERTSFYESDFDFTERKQDARTEMLQKTFAEISNGSKGKPVINDKQAEQFLHTMLGKEEKCDDDEKKSVNKPDKTVAKNDSEKEIVLSEDVTTQEITLVFKWPKRQGMPPMRQRPTPFREVHLHRVVKVTDDDVEVVDGPSVRSLENGKEVYAVSSLRRRKPVKGSEKLKEEIAKQTSQMKQFITGDIINTQPKKQNLSAGKQLHGQNITITTNNTQDPNVAKKAEDIRKSPKTVQSSKQLQRTDSDKKQTTPAQFSNRKTSQGSTTSEPQAQSQNFLTLPESMYKGESDNSDIEGLLTGAVSETDSGENYYKVMGQVDSNGMYEIHSRNLIKNSGNACLEDIDCVRSRENEDVDIYVGSRTHEGQIDSCVRNEINYDENACFDNVEECVNLRLNKCQTNLRNSSEGQGLQGDVVLCYAFLEDSRMGGFNSESISSYRNITQRHGVDKLCENVEESGFKCIENCENMPKQQRINSEDICCVNDKRKKGVDGFELISREYILDCLKPFVSDETKATGLEDEDSTIPDLIDEGFYDGDVDCWLSAWGEGQNYELWDRNRVMDEIHSLGEVGNRYRIKAEPMICNMMYRADNEESKNSSKNNKAKDRCGHDGGSDGTQVTKVTENNEGALTKDEMLKDGVPGRNLEVPGPLYTISEDGKETISGDSNLKMSKGISPFSKPKYWTPRRIGLRKAASETVLGPEVEVKSKLEKSVLSSSLPLREKGPTDVHSPAVHYDILKQYLTSKHGKKSHVVDALRHCFSLESLTASMDDVSVSGGESRDILGLGLEPGVALMDPKIDIDYPMGVVINPQALQRLEDILLGRLYRTPKYEDLHAAIESLNVDIPYSMEDLDLDTLSELLQIGCYSASSEDEDEFLGSPEGGDDDVFEDEYIETFIDFTQDNCLDISDSTDSGTMAIPGLHTPVECLETSFTGTNEHLNDKEGSKPENTDTALQQLLFDGRDEDEGLTDFCGELEIVDGKVTTVSFYSKSNKEDETLNESDSEEKYEEFEENVTTKSTVSLVTTHSNETKNDVDSGTETTSSVSTIEERYANKSKDISEDTNLRCLKKLQEFYDGRMKEQDLSVDTIASSTNDLPLTLGISVTDIDVEPVRVKKINDNQTDDRVDNEDESNDKMTTVDQVPGKRNESEDNGSTDFSQLDQEDTSGEIIDREFFSSIDSVIETVCESSVMDGEKQIKFDVKSDTVGLGQQENRQIPLNGNGNKNLGEEFEMGIQDSCVSMIEESNLGDSQNLKGEKVGSVKQENIQDIQNGNGEQIISEDRYMICVRMDFTYKKKPKINGKAIEDNIDYLVEVEKNITKTNGKSSKQLGAILSHEASTEVKESNMTNLYSEIDREVSRTAMQDGSLRPKGEKNIHKNYRNEDSLMFEDGKLDEMGVCQNGSNEEMMVFGEVENYIVHEEGISQHLGKEDEGTCQQSVKYEEYGGCYETMEPQDGGTSQQSQGQKSDNRESHEDSKRQACRVKEQGQGNMVGGGSSGGDGGDDEDRDNGKERRLDIMADIIDEENGEEEQEEEDVEAEGGDHFDMKIPVEDTKSSGKSDALEQKVSHKKKDKLQNVEKSKKTKKSKKIEKSSKIDKSRSDKGHMIDKCQIIERSQKISSTKEMKTEKEEKKPNQKESFWNQFLFDNTNIEEESNPEKQKIGKGKKVTEAVGRENNMSHRKTNISSKKIEKQQTEEGKGSKTKQKTVPSSGKKPKKQVSKRLNLAVRDKPQKEAEVKSQGQDSSSDTFWQEFLYLKSGNSEGNPYFESNIPVDVNPTTGFQEHQFWHRYLYAQRKSGPGIGGVGSKNRGMLSHMIVGEEIKQNGKKSTKQTVTRGKKVHFDMGVAEHVGESSKGYLHRSKVVGQKSVKTLRGDERIQFDVNFADDMGQKVKGHLPVEGLGGLGIEQTKSKKNRKSKKQKKEGEHGNVLNAVLKGFGSHATMATGADANTRVENEDHATQCSFTSFEYGEASESVTVGSQTQQMELKASVETHNVFVMVPSQLSFGAMNLPGLTQNIPTLMPFQMPTPQSFGQSFFTNTSFGMSSSGNLQQDTNSVVSQFDLSKTSACQEKCHLTTASTQTETPGLSDETTDSDMSTEKELEKCSADTPKDLATEEQNTDISTDIQRSTKDTIVEMSTETSSSTVSHGVQQSHISIEIEDISTEEAKTRIFTDSHPKGEDPDDKQMAMFDHENTSPDGVTVSNVEERDAGENFTSIDPKIDRFVVSIHMTPTCVGLPPFQYKVKAEETTLIDKGYTRVDGKENFKEKIDGETGTCVQQEGKIAGENGQNLEKTISAIKNSEVKEEITVVTEYSTISMEINDEENGKESNTCDKSGELEDERVEVIVKETNMNEIDLLDSNMTHPDNIEERTLLESDNKMEREEQDFETVAGNIENKDVPMSLEDVDKYETHSSTEDGDVPQSPVEKLNNSYENKVKDLDFKQYGFIDPKDYFAEAQQEHQKQVEALGLEDKKVFYMKNTSETSFEHVLTDPGGFKSTQKSSAYEEKEWSEDDEKPKYKTTQEVLLKPALGGIIEVKRESVERHRKSSVSLFLESNVEVNDDVIMVEGTGRVQKCHDSKGQGHKIQIMHADLERKDLKENISTKKDTHCCVSSNQVSKGEFISVTHETKADIKEHENITSVKVIHVNDDDVIMKSSKDISEMVCDMKKGKDNLQGSNVDNLEVQSENKLDQGIDGKIFIEGLGELKILKGKEHAHVVGDVDWGKHIERKCENTVDVTNETLIDTAISEKIEQKEMNVMKNYEKETHLSHGTQEEKQYNSCPYDVDADKEVAETEENCKNKNVTEKKFEDSEENCSFEKVEKVSIMSKSEGFYNYAKQGSLQQTENHGSCEEEYSSIATGSTSELPPSDKLLDIVKTDMSSDRIEGEYKKALENEQRKDLKLELKSLLNKREVQQPNVSLDSHSYKMSPFAGDEFMMRRRLQELVKPQKEKLGEWKVEQRRFSTSGCETERSRYTVPLQVQHSTRRYSTSSVHGPVIKPKNYLKQNKVRGYLDWATEKELESLLHNYTRSQQESAGSQPSFLDFLENCISQTIYERSLESEPGTDLSSNDNKTVTSESGTGLVENGGAVSSFSHESVQGLVLPPDDECEDKPFRSAIKCRKSLTDIKTMRKREKIVKKHVLGSTSKGDMKLDGKSSVIEKENGTSIRNKCSSAEVQLESTVEKVTESVDGHGKEGTAKVLDTSDGESIGKDQEIDKSGSEKKRVKIVREYLTEKESVDGSCLNVKSEVDTTLTDDVIEQDGCIEVKVISPRRRSENENVEKTAGFERKEGTQQVEIIREYLMEDGDGVYLQGEEENSNTHNDNTS